MKNLIRLGLGVIVVLLFFILFKTLSFSSMQVKPEPSKLPIIDNKSVVNLSNAITYQTITNENNYPVDSSAFIGFIKFVSEAYPLIHSAIKKEIIADYSLLYTWQGKNLNLKPVILMAHMDVVPAEEPGSWTKPPFSGENDGTYIWGRGTLDNKGEMIMILEAVEKLLGENYQPERTIYLAFGHDEEPGGNRGAAAIASSLKARGVNAEYILDEGLAVTLGIVPMISKPVAMIGISEKGSMSVNLTVEFPGGHSSYPEKETAITILTKAINNLSDQQMKVKITKTVADFIRYIGPEMPLYVKIIFANRWLFEPVILKIYQRNKTSSASVRTTTATTIIHAGSRDNVIPVKAEAVVNFRILPGDVSTDVTEHLQNVIADNRVKISILGGTDEASPVSPVDVLGFKTIHTTIGQVYPEALIVPSMMVGMTDSRHYIGLTQNIYKFAPIAVTAEDLARIHGLDERIKIEEFKRGIIFFYQLVKNSN